VADPEHLDLLRQGVDVWNGWRAEKASIRPDLSGADLREANLSGANPRAPSLGAADLHDANLHDANLSGANLRGAYLGKANLNGANLVEADLRDANLGVAYLAAANLSEANLNGANLSWARLNGANLSWAQLNGANLVEADLRDANLREAGLSGANLNGANLHRTNLHGANLIRASLGSAALVETNLSDAVLTGCHIYGISAWNLKLSEGTKLQDLIITSRGEPAITVDNIEVAQFVYLLLHNEKIRDVIDTVGKKGVLLLGRFTEGRIVVLERLRDELRKRGYLPIVFNFDKPETKDFTETVRLLAGLSKFVIADITNPKSAPLELQATVPEIMVPFRPIIEEGEEPFAMLRDLWIKHRDWVFEPIYYSSVDALITSLDEKIIRPAEARFVELVKRKAETMKGEHV
jgi:uncharacterized protein YjbI with pentapeptide repeats